MTEDDGPCEVVITAPDAAWLAEFCRQLVADGLCASAHNFDPIRSIYKWRGEIHDTTEARAALHTRRGLIGTIVDRTNSQHPYEVPDVSVLPIVGGNPAYLDWIMSETQGNN